MTLYKKQIEEAGLTQDEEDSQREEHHSKRQTTDSQGVIVCKGD